jgi:signal transduction histidine kinase
MFESQDEDQQLIELISASTELGLMIQRKQTEGKIRKALEKEKELTELKSRFITMTSHEFRTPLTTIQSSAELLEHYSHNWTDQRKFTHLHRIQLSVKHMTKLLNDVLILGKADAGNSS